MKKRKFWVCIILMVLLAQLFVPIVLADTDMEITFVDDELKQCILNNCDENKDGKVTKSEIEKLTSIYVNGRNFDGMQYAINLEELSINYGFSNLEYNLSALTNLPKLKKITIWGYSDQKYSDFAELANINSLEEITLSNLQILQGDFDKLGKLPNLKKAQIWLGSLISKDKKVEISEISKLTNIEELEITNSAYDNLYLDTNYLKPLTKLNKINFRNVSVINEDEIANCRNLQNITIDGGKITSIKFAKDLKKLNMIDCSNNFITDLSPLKGTSAYVIRMENNPIDPSQEGNKQVINSVQNIILSDYSTMKNLKFKNEDFKEVLLKNGDLNRDGEISIYEMGKITYLQLTNVSYLLENSEYLTNLNDLTFEELDGNADLQKELITQVNSLKLDSININNIVVNLGTVICSNNKYKCNLSEIFPILNETKKSGSIFEIKNSKLNEIVNYESVGEIKDENIEIPIDSTGLKKRTFCISGNNKSMNIELKLTVINNGDDKKEIYFEDNNLKNEILKKYDQNNDGKITQNELALVDVLEISNKNIYSLKGLENAKNITCLYADGNHIKDISPIIGIVKKDARYLLDNNEITDVSPLLNNNTNISMLISLDENYIDFSEGSENLKAIKYNYAKENNIERSSLINYVICNQRYGKPEDKNNVVNLDSNIKKKLIRLGLDTNKDGNITREELYNAKKTCFKIDLSGLGVNSVSGLEYLRCYELDISNNNIVDITPISKNRLFRVVNFSHNKIKDISSLAKINNYFWGKIDFSYNQIENISSISSWPVMKYDGWEELFAGDGNIREITIDLSNNNIKDISAVKNWRHIGKLDLSNNKITNISALSNFDFRCMIDEDGSYEECLDEFEGIILKNNKIDITREDNKKAVNMFKNKGVTLDITNQEAQRFDDVAKNEWYYNAVKYVYEHKIMSGINSSTFAPDQKLTRGMIVTMLYNMENHPSVKGTSKFADVQNKNVYFYNAVVWASNNNIVSGYANGKFGPDDNITREQLATILYNYCRYKGKYKTVYADYSKFTDSNKISSFAKWGMNWAVGHKIVNGSNGKLNPQGTATRAEAATMISNYCNTIK